jgi:hypothetical protein
MLLLHGMAGIGKTTLAKAVFIDCSAQLAADDDVRSCFVVLEQVMQEAGIVQVQQQLLADLAKDASFQLNSAAQGRQQLATKLQDKKVLLVVDNVWGDQLAKLLPRDVVEVLGEGSVVLVTSRLARCCDSFAGPDKVAVRCLTAEASLELFCLYAYGKSGPPDAQHEQVKQEQEQVKQIVAQCGGLPMALEVVGRHMRRCSNRPRFFYDMPAAVAWAFRNDHAVDKVGERTLFAAQRLSWNALGAKEQEALLDIVWFLQGQPWEVVQTCFEYGVLDRLWQQGLVQRIQVEQAELPGGCGVPGAGYASVEQLRGGMLEGSLRVDCVGVHVTVVAFCKAESSGRGGQQRLDVDGGAAGVAAGASLLMKVCHVTVRARCTALRATAVCTSHCCPQWS